MDSRSGHHVASRVTMTGSEPASGLPLFGRYCVYHFPAYLLKERRQSDMSSTSSCGVNSECSERLSSELSKSCHVVFQNHLIAGYLMFVSVCIGGPK